MEPSIINPIIPKEGNFEYKLARGASQLSTYDKKFEVHVDMQDYKRENVRIKITRDGIINLRILSDSAYGDSDILYDENIIIPKHEKVRRKSITCAINGDGILKISGVPDQENLISLTQSGPEFGNVSQNPFGNIFSGNPLMLTIIKPRIFKSIVETRKEREVSTPWGQIKMGSTITQTADESAPAPPENEKFEATVMAPDYLDELFINIRDNWLTINGKNKTSLFEQNPAHRNTFTKKIQIPETIKPESIVCGQDPITGMVYITNIASKS